jgi:acyl-coenzyme A synthetase/AMP-(fatty) acid ligase
VRALAVSAEGEQHRLSDPQLQELTRRIAAGFHDRGIGAGDVVLVRLPKGPEWLCTMRALFRIGAVALPCVEQVTEREVAERRELTRAGATVLEPADVPLADGPAPVADLPDDAPGFLIFTSGTEGRPKAAVHPRRYLEANRLQLERWMGVRPGDRVWCTAAPGWSKSVRNVWFPAELYGCETVLAAGRFHAAERLEQLAALQPQVLCMSPTEYRLCAKAPAFGSHDLRGIREAVAAGEALDGPTLERWREAYGITVRDGYGQTECGAVTGVLVGEEPLPGSMGHAMPGVELAIVDGELCLRPETLPTFFSGYLDDPVATGAKLRDGLWHTGDLVQRDDDGRLWYQGRADDVISSAGYRIGPGEVETALASHPAVLEAAAIGLPDEDRGAIVHADVVLQPGAVASDDLRRALQDHVRQVTAPYKYPRSLRFVAALPRTATGKLRRGAIRAELDPASPGRSAPLGGPT